MNDDKKRYIGELDNEIARLRAELDLARTGRMMSIADLQTWREADHEDAITLHRNFIIVILTTLDRLRAECVRLEDHINDADDEGIRLRAEVERQKLNREALSQEASRLRAEVERLTKQASSPVHANCHEVDDANLRLMRDNERLRREIQILSARLAEWKDGYEKIRAALAADGKLRE